MLGSPTLIGTKVILKTPLPPPVSKQDSRAVWGQAVWNVKLALQSGFSVSYVVLMYLTFNNLTES